MEYGPSKWQWVADQVAEYEASGGSKANTLLDTGIPIIVITTIGHRSGLVRKVPLMRVEHDGEYALIASKGGAAEHPGWFHNLLADPSIKLQDGSEAIDYKVRRVHGPERDEWYARGVDVYPPYADYRVSASKHGREIPVFVATPPIRPDQPMVDKKPSVLFLCVHNAGRSQMAAGWLRHLAGDGVEVFSGGTAPVDGINPVAVEAMAEVGIDIAGEQPTRWSDGQARAADVIVSMGCGDTCPAYPGKRREDWALVDPAGESLEVVREVRDNIRDRVRDLMASLGLDIH